MADVPATLDAQVPGWLARDGVPSLAIAYVARGAVQWTRVYGEARPGVPASPQTVYNVASLTKPVVAEVVLRLAAAGRVNLTAPVSAVWTDPDLVGDPRADSLTLTLLLSHRAGFPNWRYETGNRLRFIAAPGIGFNYSGEGFEYAARVLERTLSGPLDTIADAALFRPSGLTAMSFTRRAWMGDRAAHSRGPDGVWSPPAYSAVGNAADDLYATIGDYARFLLVSTTRQGLPSAWTFRRDSLLVVEPDGTRICNPAVAARCPSRAGYGLGWSLLEFPATNTLPAARVVWHTGIDRGERTMAVWLPEENRGMVLFTNGTNGFQTIIDAGLVVLCGSPFTGILRSGKP